MQSSLVQLLDKWFSLLGIPVSKDYLKELLLSHPHYPSLLSITDTLHELGVEHAAVKAEKEQHGELPVPYLAFLDSNGGDFVIVEKSIDSEKEIPGFFAHWTGIVVAVERPVQWVHAVNEEYLKKDKQKSKRLLTTGLVIGLSAIIPLLFFFSWLPVLTLLVSSAGLFISFLIITKELGIENKMADRVCGKEADCASLVQSKNIKLPGGVSWGDIGVIWYTSLLVQLVISTTAGISTSFLLIQAILSAGALFFTPFSVYYQWLVAKKWCRLCLIIVALLWIQFFLLLPGLNTAAWNLVGIAQIFFTAFVMVLMSSIWLWIKPVLVKQGESEKNWYSLMQLKMNPDVFIGLLERQRQVDTHPFTYDLQTGNSKASVQVIVACSPYCVPCARAHAVLHYLAANDIIGLTVRFAINANSKEDKRTQTIRYILQLLINSDASFKRKVLHDWYRIMDLEKFRKQYHLSKPADVDEYVQLHERWTQKSNITFTPTIFINGYELPAQYTVNDLPALLTKIAGMDNSIAGNEISEQQAEDNFAFA